MATVNVHTGVMTSPKFGPLSDGAFRLWFHGLMWSKEHLTDGFIPTGMLPTLHRQAKRLTVELLRVHVPGKGPLWHQEPEGYRIHDFADWQDVSEVVQGRRRKWREQKRGVKATSVQDSTPESAVESILDSRAGGGGGVGGGCGGGTENRSRDDDTTLVDGGSGAAPVARLVSSSPTGGGLGPEHLAAQELVDGWNRICGRSVRFHELQPASKRALRVALQAKGLDTWERIFARVQASDYLSGRLGDMPAMGLFDVIEKADLIDEGKYDNRQRAAVAVPEAAPSRWAIDIEAEVERQRAKAAARGRAS